MPNTSRERAIPALLAGVSLALAFAQRPGLATADTKINLHVAPGRFLADVASMWSSSGQLGAVQAGQQTGYLFPMGPFFAAGHALGLSDWVVQRLWLGSLLALAAWGVVRLLDALLPERRGIAHLTAGAVLVLNPFVVTYVNRTTVTLLAYTALPWLLLTAHRGLREPRGWRWPAAVALLVTASGGGVNGAVTAWMLVGPALLLLYEPLFTPVTFSQVGAFLLRAIPLTVLVSLWWIIPAYVQASYGADFLRFTEQPGTVWGTTSLPESLRLMSFWLSYVGIGFAGKTIPLFDDSRTLLFSAPVVLATLLLPAAALTGFLATRRWRYGPFFLALAIAALLIIGAGYPDGTPLRHGLTFTYNHVSAVRFLRASYKAAPLLAVALACLGGVAASAGWVWLRARHVGWGVPALAVLAVAAVLALAAWPLVTGRAQDAQVSFQRVPTAWHAVAADLDRGLPSNSRAVVLPGELFSFYTWGGTVDPILPALSRRPVAVRSEVPYADFHAADLLWTIDGLVHQQRLLPGQLAPLLGLIGVRSVVTGTDDDQARSDAPAPADAASTLANQGLGRPTRSYGRVSRFTPTGLGPDVSLPEVRRYDIAPGRGLISVLPRAAPVVVDGSAGGLAQLAAFGGLPPARPILYAGDLTAPQLRAAVAQGGGLVVSDSNRRRAFAAASLEQNLGPTLTPEESVSADGIILDPFGRGPDYETVASYTGVRAVHSPASPETVQFPERAPFAAIDGSTQTAWLADPTLAPDRRWLEVDFDHQIDVRYVDLLPADGRAGSLREVQIAKRTFALHPGWNHLPLNLRAVPSLRVTLTSVQPPAGLAASGAGGIDELRIPGVRAVEQLRVPVDAASALRSSDLTDVPLTYLFERTTGDDPFHRDPASASSTSRNAHEPGDAEQQMRRIFELPARRSFAAAAWVNVPAQTPDNVLDRLAGYGGPVAATSSGRFDGAPQWRASRALDGNPATAWIGDYDRSRSAWLQWTSRTPVSISTLRLLPPSQPVRRPARVRLSWPGGSTPPLAVSASGMVKLPQTVRARAVRLEILDAVAPSGASPAQQRAVGIAELEGVGGLPPVPPPIGHSFKAPCGAARLLVGQATVSLRVAGTTSQFERGDPLQARSCGAPVPLGPGARYLVAAAGPFAIDELRLSSPAPNPRPTPAAGGGAVLDSGSTGRGSYDHVRLSVTTPSWLVLGEGYNRGWRAWCGGRSLGTPVRIDGYANGWPIEPTCHEVRFAFAPNKLAAVGYGASVLGALVCLAILLRPVWRRRRRPLDRAAVQAPAPIVPAPEPAPRWPLSRALLCGLVAGGVFAFVFGAKAGAASVPVIALVLWRGIDAAPLILTAGLLLGIVVPLLYVAHPAPEQGGNHYSYAAEHMTAHWVAVAAVGLLMLALWRTLRAARAMRAG